MKRAMCCPWLGLLAVLGAALIGVAVVGLSWCWAQRAAPDRAEPLAKMLLESLDTQAAFCVHLGVSDGALTTALSQNGKYLVHGIAHDDESVAAARGKIESAKLAGVVSVEKAALRRLPYADHLAGLLVIDDLPAAVEHGLSLAEVQRVLRPGGVAWLGESATGEKLTLTRESLGRVLGEAGVKQFEIVERDGLWARFVAPRPDTMGRWTHKRHDAGGNPVSADRDVDVPSGVRWLAGPNWPTGYRKSAVPAVVSTERRLVYIFQDEAPASDSTGALTSVPQDSLIARDAFSGLLLWKLKATKSSAALAAEGDRVYAVLEDSGPLLALDADTGRVVHTFAGTRSPKQVLVLEGRLLVDLPEGLACFDAATAELKWKYAAPPQRFVAEQGRVYLHTTARDEAGRSGSRFVCLNLADGKSRWEKPTESWTRGSPTLVLVRDGVLVAAGASGNHGLLAEDGSHLWSYDYPTIGHGGSYQKVLVQDGLVWIHTASSQGSKRYAWEGLDPVKGSVVKRLLQPEGYSMKHRCSYDVASAKLVMCGSMDFADFSSGEYDHFTAARNSCASAGVVPANGLVYSFPHACGCYSMLRGFLGLESRPLPDVDPLDAARLMRGPAYEDIVGGPVEGDDQWPTYRHDPLRTAGTKAPGPEALDVLWSAQVADPVSDALAAEWDLKDGGRLSSPVIAGGLALVAASDQHRLAAFDAKTGAPKWTFTAGGRIDCPPTVDGGCSLFGARDGYVYCVKNADGALIWKLLVAPRDERVIAYGQLESKWPIVGGVLVYDGLAYCAVGRHSGSDGGITVYAIEPHSGKAVWARKAENHDGVIDLLNAADGTVQMAEQEFEAKSGKPGEADDARIRGGRLGLLNDAWYKRPIAMRKNLQLWQATGRASAQMIAFHESATCGFLACSSVAGGDGKMSGDAVLFVKAEGKGQDWSLKMPLDVRLRGMAITPERGYVAGLLPERDGKRTTNLVRAYALADGKLLAEAPLEGAPVHDGLAVAGERVYVATQQGRLICLGSK
jgi:outer membrane protein assembly factor BamB